MKRGVFRRRRREKNCVPTISDAAFDIAEAVVQIQVGLAVAFFKSFEHGVVWLFRSDVATVNGVRNAF